MADAAMPMVAVTDGAYYWMKEHPEAGWVVVLARAGFFYPAGRDYSITPALIAGPIPPPPDP